MDEKTPKRTLRKPVKQQEPTYMYQKSDSPPLIKKKEVVLKQPEVIKVDRNFGPVIFCCVICGKTNKQTTVCRWCTKCIECSPLPNHRSCWNNTLVNIYHLDVDQVDVTANPRFKRCMFLDLCFGLDFIPSTLQMEELTRDLLSSIVLWRKRNLP